MSLSRRHVLAAFALIPLAACTTPAPTGAPASTSAATTAAPSTAPAVDADVTVFMPGAMAAHSKALAAAFDVGGAKTIVEVGHTPIQREQLAKGATPDVWVAANPNDMKSAAEAGLVVADKVQQLARTRLVIVVAPGNPGGVTGITDLAKPGLKVLLGAETLPVWMVTKKGLDKVEATEPGFTEKVTANTVSREMGVQPIVTKVTKGEADAGIVFVTDVPADAETVEIPDEFNAELALSIAPVTAAKNSQGAAAFIAFMTAGDGAEILTKAGYLPPAAA
ncbi:MAG TPA: molybdate ABC transporter substrate-binding protein [Propionibacterium sp.]|nr:molybdate ABC transporter substrate-binding protein [Propionibacterium sp.]